MLPYRICGCEFESSMPLPELEPAPGTQPEFQFRMSTQACNEPQAGDWLNYWYAQDGSTWLAFARYDGGYLLRFPGLADYVVSADARSITCRSQQAIPEETVRHLLLNQVIPITLSHLGKLVLHASACLTDKGAIAFAGFTGAGKSTLAASFGVRGFPVLTDDCLRIEERDGRMMSYPSYPGLRLWPESVEELFDHEPALQTLAHYTEKKRLLFEADTAEAPFPLRCVFILAPVEEYGETSGVRISPLTASAALLATIKHTFQLDVTDRSHVTASFRRHERLIRHVPFFELTFPQQFECLPAVHQAILQHLDA